MPATISLVDVGLNESGHGSDVRLVYYVSRGARAEP